ncbi:MAG: hypothetical protein ABSD72_08310 [Terracidiphilus sp.]|jgi:hypothetical protein
MDTNDAKDQAIHPRDNQACPLFSGDKDCRYYGEKTRKIIQPEHPHSVSPFQMANGREEINDISYVLPQHFVEQMACQIALVGRENCSTRGINQLAATSLICGKRVNQN